MERDKGYLWDVLEAAALALSYVEGKSKEQFLEDMQCQDAVIRRLEIIGEAVVRTSEETQSTLPDLPWRDMVGMRNVLIHSYREVDLGIVWDTLQQDLPALVRSLNKLFPSDS